MIKTKKFPLSFQHSAVVIFITFLSLIAFVFENQLLEQFIYQRTLITQGELWRLFTGHLFHTNGFHLMLNLSAIVLLWSLHGQFYTINNYSFLWLTSALSTSLGLYFFSPDLIRYVGLSGVLHGIFVWGAMMDIKQKDKTGYLLFVGVWLKILHEQFSGPSQDIANLIQANVAIDAHLWGAFGGLLVGLLTFTFVPLKNNAQGQ
jgi:rhomboid family GlyGly-CTERM serine protease